MLPPCRSRDSWLREYLGRWRRRPRLRCRMSIRAGAVPVDHAARIPGAWVSLYANVRKLRSVVTVLPLPIAALTALAASSLRSCSCQMPRIFTTSRTPGRASAAPSIAACFSTHPDVERCAVRGAFISSYPPGAIRACRSNRACSDSRRCLSAIPRRQCLDVGRRAGRLYRSRGETPEYGPEARTPKEEITAGARAGMSPH